MKRLIRKFLKWVITKEESKPIGLSAEEIALMGRVCRHDIQMVLERVSGPGPRPRRSGATTMLILNTLSVAMRYAGEEVPVIDHVPAIHAHQRMCGEVERFIKQAGLSGFTVNYANRTVVYDPWKMMEEI